MESKIMVRVVHVKGDVSNSVHVWHRFLECVNRLHVCVLASDHHLFPGGSMTGTVILSESHAAIHTWPEAGYAWCELATCGDPADCDLFERLLKHTFN